MLPLGLADAQHLACIRSETARIGTQGNACFDPLHVNTKMSLAMIRMKQIRSAKAGVDRVSTAQTYVRNPIPLDACSIA